MTTPHDTLNQAVADIQYARDAYDNIIGQQGAALTSGELQISNLQAVLAAANGTIAQQTQTIADRNARIQDLVDALAQYWQPGQVEPTAQTTGSAPRDQLRNYAGTVNLTDGARLDGYNITGGPVTVTGSTQFVNCWFGNAVTAKSDGGQIDSRAAGVTRTFVDRCTFQPDTPNGYTDALIGHHLTVQRCTVRDVVDFVGGYNTKGPDVDNHVLGNYVERLAWWYPDPTGEHTDGTHNDCVQHQGGVGLEVVGNAFHGYIRDLTVNSTQYNPSRTVGQIVLVQMNTGSVSNVRINRNWIYGGANGIKFVSKSSQGYKLGPVEAVTNVWQDKGQRDYTGRGSKYYFRADPGVVLNGKSYAATTTRHPDWGGNVFADGTPVTVRVDP